MLSPISDALQRGILLRRENPTYAYWRGRSLQRGVVLKWFYSTRAVGTPLSDSEVRAFYRVPSSSVCGRLSWLPVRFLLHLKYTPSYRIVSYRIQDVLLLFARWHYQTFAVLFAQFFWILVRIGPECSGMILLPVLFGFILK